MYDKEMTKHFLWRGEDAAFEGVGRIMERDPPRESRALSTPHFSPATLTSHAWLLEPSMSKLLFNLPRSRGSFWKHADLGSCSSCGQHRQSKGHNL